VAPASALVSYERRGAAGWLTLNRPHKRNALVPALLGDLHRALDACDADPRVRATVVTGAGDAFCAGADLGYLTGKLDEPDGCEEFIAGLLRPLAAALARLRESPRPVIGAVNGACFAGGLELLVTCDLVIAAERATFCDGHARRGLFPAVGGAAGLVSVIGAARATRMLMLSEVLSAADMALAGLVSEVVPDDQLPVRAGELAALIASRSPASIAAAKVAVHRCEPRPWPEVVEQDIEDFRRHWSSPQLREGIEAFLAKREPRYWARDAQPPCDVRE
jgi:enoyl-CoA hydratase/carnithine racemase